MVAGNEFGEGSDELALVVEGQIVLEEGFSEVVEEFELDLFGVGCLGQWECTSSWRKRK